MMSRSRPAATSAIVVDQAWVRQGPWRAKSTSSSPTAVTAPTRAGSSTSGVPYAITASFTVCQSQPSSRATSATVRACRPTCSVAHRLARSVIASLGAAMRRSWLVHDPTGQASSGQHQRCLCHISRAGRPKQPRSTNSTTGRSFTHPSRAALGADGPLHALFDMHTDRFTALVIDREDNHISHGDEERAHARSVGLHRGSEGSVGVATADSSGPCAAPGGPRLWAASSICPPAAN